MNASGFMGIFLSLFFAFRVASCLSSDLHVGGEGYFEKYIYRSLSAKQTEEMNEHHRYVSNGRRKRQRGEEDR